MANIYIGNCFVGSRLPHFLHELSTALLQRDGALDINGVRRIVALAVVHDKVDVTHECLLGRISAVVQVVFHRLQICS